jgi:hypothetical protein
MRDDDASFVAISDPASRVTTEEPMTDLRVPLPNGLKKFVAARSRAERRTPASFVRDLVADEKRRHDAERREILGRYLALCEAQVRAGRFGRRSAENILAAARRRVAKRIAPG